MMEPLASLQELNREQHGALRPLFAGFGCRLHGLVEATFSGDFGEAWADDPDTPAVALVHIDFWLVAGDATVPGAAAALSMVRSGTIVTGGSPAWDAHVRATFAGRIVERTRTAFANAPQSRHRTRLVAQARALPDGLVIRRITAANLNSFLEVAKEFASNWRTTADFLDRGVAFGVFDGERCVAGCSSFTLANSKMEIEIDTDPEYRRRGLARAVAATQILHCMDAGIEPCWDAHNRPSAQLALQLGFSGPQPYTVFVVGPGAAPA